MSVYRNENGVLVPYANNSGQSQASTINIIDKNGLVTTAGETTDEQTLINKMSDNLGALSSDIVKYHDDNLAFNSVGKYIFSGDIKCIAARVKTAGNYAIIVGNNNTNTAFLLYNTESTSFDRVTSSPTLAVEWWTQP